MKYQTIKIRERKMVTLNSYMMFIEDTMNHRKAYFRRLFNNTSDPKLYELHTSYTYNEIREFIGNNVADYKEMPITEFLEDGHTYQWYLVYAPMDTVMYNVESNDMLEWIIQSRIVEDEHITFTEEVKLRDVISESGIWTYNRDQAIDDNKYTVLGTGTNPYTTL